MKKRRRKRRAEEIVVHCPILVNAEAMHAQHPDTFSLPDDRNDLEPGDMAKICCNGERFWVEVVYAEDGCYVGAVSNVLIIPANRHLDYGEFVEFAGCNVYQTHKAPKK